MRLGLLMRRMALDWILLRRQRVDFGAPPTCSTLKNDKFGTCRLLEGEKMRKTRGLWRGHRSLEMHVYQGIHCVHRHS